MISVLVTGGAGYIGSHICKALKNNGYNPITIDNLSCGYKELVKFGDFVLGDIGDAKLVKEIIKKYNIQAVFHIAASKSTFDSVKSPYEYYMNNLFATNTLLKTSIDERVKYFIFASTSAIFNSTNPKIGENDTKNPLTPYGLSKLMVENILDTYDVAYGLKSIAFRYFNVVGSDPELEIGDLSVNNKNLLNCVFKSIKEKTKFYINGNDYNTPDGTCVRDYVHVSDIAEANVLALKKLMQDNKSMKINLGNGNGFSVKQMVNAAEKITGIKLNVIMSGRREGDAEISVCNSDLAKSYLGWKPKYSDLEKQVEDAWNWYKKSLL
ncbi:MAG TPA: UDP-glucose 4-epimerase GalE [Rickettsiales bacterium]|nr:UDP-glucose 4-epimerase GalE [Rickettsiales bacterium]